MWWWLMGALSESSHSQSSAHHAHCHRIYWSIFSYSFGCRSLFNSFSILFCWLFVRLSNIKYIFCDWTNVRIEYANHCQKRNKIDCSLTSLLYLMIFFFIHFLLFCLSSSCVEKQILSWKHFCSLCVCVCVCVIVYASLRVCVCVCACVYIFFYIYIYIVDANAGCWWFNLLSVFRCCFCSLVCLFDAVRNCFGRYMENLVPRQSNRIYFICCICVEGYKIIAFVHVHMKCVYVSAVRYDNHPLSYFLLLLLLCYCWMMIGYTCTRNGLEVRKENISY